MRLWLLDISPPPACCCVKKTQSHMTIFCKSWYFQQIVTFSFFLSRQLCLSVSPLPSLSFFGDCHIPCLKSETKKVAPKKKISLFMQSLSVLLSNSFMTHLNVFNHYFSTSSCRLVPRPFTLDVCLNDVISSGLYSCYTQMGWRNKKESCVSIWCCSLMCHQSSFN